MREVRGVTTVILLVLVCIATATLLAWLAVELVRIALGEHAYARVPALLHGVIGAVRVPALLHGVIGAVRVPALLHGVIGAVRVPGELLREVRRRQRFEPDPNPVPPAAPSTPVDGPAVDVWAEPWEVDETVERMVRERLYGNRTSAGYRVD